MDVELKIKYDIRTRQIVAKKQNQAQPNRFPINQLKNKSNDTSTTRKKVDSS